MIWRNVGKKAIAFILLGLGLWLLVPGRNVAGNPWMEDLIDECQMIESGERIRLYQMNGGATEALSYSATIDPGMLARERQFFFAYSSPQVEHVKCEARQVTLVGLDQSFTFPIEKIYHDLLGKPVILYRGTPEDMTNGFRIVAVIVGLLFLLVGLSLGFWPPKERA
jgi:hypothetical protein